MALETKKLPIWEILFIIFLYAIYFLPSVSLGSTILLAILLVYCSFIAFVDQGISFTIVKVLFFIVASSVFPLLYNTSTPQESTLFFTSIGVQ